MRFFAFVLALFVVSNPARALTPEFHGYVRAAAGTNGKGGKQDCIHNRGAAGNEFRLGNECGIYGESAITAPILKTTEEEPYFLSLFRLAYTPPGNTVFERSVPGPVFKTNPAGYEVGSNESLFGVVEAFVEGGRFNGLPYSYWVGKRFYRDVDVVMNDWYYYAHMSGNGGGIGNIPLLGGQLAAAVLFETGSTFTNKGQNQNQILDFRWQQIPIGTRDQMNFWAAGGMAPGGAGPSGQSYVARKGWVVGSRWRHNLWDGFHDLTVVYGRGLLESASVYGNPALLQAADNPGSTADRLRFVSNWNVQPLPRFGFHAAATFETWNPRINGVDALGTWWNVGARPIWFLSKHTQLAFEAGHSVVQIRNERNADGSLMGARHLTRFTIAPQLAIDDKLWARPVLRAFYSYSFWNDANKTYVGLDSPSFAGQSAGQNIGLQTEVWF